MLIALGTNIWSFGRKSESVYNSTMSKSGNMEAAAGAYGETAALLQQLSACITQVKNMTTKAENYFIVQKAETVSDIEGLEVRLSHLEKWYAKFEDLRFRLRSLLPAYCEDSQLDSLEEKYYSVVSSIKRLLKKSVSHESSSSIESLVQCKLNNKLPDMAIPQFDGKDITKYKPFMELFKAIVGNNVHLMEIQKLYYLKMYLKGEALALIDNLPLDKQSYDMAMDLLAKRFDNKYLLIINHVNLLLDLQPMVKETSQMLRDFVSLVRSQLGALRAMRQPADSWDMLLIPMLTRKLDPCTCRAYHLDRHSNDENGIIPEVRMSSRLSALPVVAELQGTRGGQSSSAPPAAPPAYHSRRRNRDRLFWTLIGNSARTPNSRSRMSGYPQTRGPRSINFFDLLESSQSMTSRYPSLASNDTGSQSARFPSVGHSHSTARPSERNESNCARHANSNGRQVILLRQTQASERPSGAPVGDNPDAMQPIYDDLEAQADSPQAVESADDYVETVVEVAEEPVNLTSSLSLDEVVEVDPPSPAPAVPPDAPAELAVPSGSSEESSLQPRAAKKRKEGNTHESVSTLNMSLLRLLECPVCMEWMEPPIAQCRRGHLVCGACRGRLDVCPVCRTAFSSVRNRAMEQVAGTLRYPCRHGCGREVRQARRARHEASCAWRRYACPLPACDATPPMPRAALPAHCQSRHPQHFKAGARQRVSLRVNCEQHQHWVVSALGQLFHARVDVDVHTWGVVVHVAYVGPQNHAGNYTYEVTVTGRHNSRKLTYKRSTHSDLENTQLNTSRQDCFHLTLDQALNFLRYNNEHSETDKTLDFVIVLAENEPEEDSREISDSSLSADVRS